jgi:hypothetical protein
MKHRGEAFLLFDGRTSPVRALTVSRLHERASKLLDFFFTRFLHSFDLFRPQELLRAA